MLSSDCLLHVGAAAQKGEEKKRSLALSEKVEWQPKPAVECMILIPMTFGCYAFYTISKQETVVKRTKEPTEKQSPHSHFFPCISWQHFGESS